MKLGKEIMNKMRSPTKKQQPSKESNTNPKIKNMNQRDGTGREVGGGFRMGNTSIPVVDSC